MLVSTATNSPGVSAELHSNMIDRQNNLDATDFLRNHVSRPQVAPRSFVYLDPPYFAKGSQLYLNFYCPDDHHRLAHYLKQEANFSLVTCPMTMCRRFALFTVTSGRLRSLSDIARVTP